MAAEPRLRRPAPDERLHREDSMTDNRLAGADFMRASACIVVLGHHLAQRMKWGEPVGWMEWLRVFDLTGGFGVSLFFILSGFLLAHPFWQALERGEPL